jgi:hypothetical protein
VLPRCDRSCESRANSHTGLGITMSLSRACVVAALGLGVLACIGADLRAARVDVAATPQRVAPGQIVIVPVSIRDLPPGTFDADEINLENDEIDYDPDIETNYNIDRIEEVTIPGPVIVPPPGLLPQ